jgi:uncharacterized protein (TIGR03118 family)
MNLRHSRVVLVFCLLLFAAATTPGFAPGRFTQIDLVSDQPGLAPNTDPNLVNPWGIAKGPTSPLWVADEGTGKSTIYTGNGTPLSLVVTIPPASGTGQGTPTGIVFNDSAEFVVTNGTASGASVFIFASLDGAITGWSPGVDLNNALIGTTRNGSVYTGLAIANTLTGKRLYAADFANGVVDIYDGTFTYLSSFTDPTLQAAGYGPFGIQTIDGQVFVTFAVIGDEGEEEPGPGLGYVDIFETDGTFVRQLAAQGPLNAPWGLAQAPGGFGNLRGAILVGNFGDGRINAYNKVTGAYLGAVVDQFGFPLENEGLWGITFGNGTANGGAKNALFFAAGIEDETHGLFGKIVTFGTQNPKVE